MLSGIAVLTLVGFAFKVAVVPFHFWTPDVYEGAPTPITAYVSTASKAAGFAVLVRVMLVAFPEIQVTWAAILAAMATATMTLGNVLAIAQKNIKRLLAYSSIAHAGYALIGLVALSQFGAASVLFYLIAYVVTNLTAFGIVILFARSAGSDEIADYAGLSRRSPWLAFALLIAFLSLAGMPLRPQSLRDCVGGLHCRYFDRGDPQWSVAGMDHRFGAGAVLVGSLHAPAKDRLWSGGPAGVELGAESRGQQAVIYRRTHARAHVELGWQAAKIRQKG
jgi:hypothetical protein